MEHYKSDCTKCFLQEQVTVLPREKHKLEVQKGLAITVLFVVAMKDANPWSQ